jgi:hypothetical protein
MEAKMVLLLADPDHVGMIQPTTKIPQSKFLPKPLSQFNPIIQYVI